MAWDSIRRFDYEGLLMPNNAAHVKPKDRLEKVKPGDDQGLERRAIAAAKTGDWDAIHFLYARYADDVRVFVTSILKDHHDAEDVTQSLFARLPHAILRYEERDVAFLAWLMRVARNAALDFLRTRRQIPTEEVMVDDAGTDQANAERRRTLKLAFDMLPEDQRRVLVMRHVVGLSPGEIAQRLQKSEGSIHGLHHRGRGSLKQILTDLESAPVVSRA
jgi:RNA polymerase sigma-70 factor (ECF subfamily)